MTKVEISAELNRAIERAVLKSIKTIAEDVCEMTAKRYFNDYLGNKINLEIEKHLTSNLERQILIILKEYKLVPENNYELSSKSVRGYIEYCEKNEGLENHIIDVDTESVYKEYADFCVQNKIAPLNKPWFSRELKRQTGISTRVATVRRKSVRVYTQVVEMEGDNE